MNQGGSCSVDYIIENVEQEGFYDEAHVSTAKAGSTFTLIVKNVPDASKLNLTFKPLNTYVAPRELLQLTFHDGLPNQNLMRLQPAYSVFVRDKIRCAQSSFSTLEHD